MSAQRKFALRLTTTVVATGLLVLGAAGVASAHVTAHSPDTLTKGGFAEIVFRVPDEEATAHTTRIEVDFSATAPVPDAQLKPVDGWTATVTMMNLPKPVNTNNETLTTAVKSITWAAPKGQGIAPGQFQEFPIVVEGLPDTDTMVMPAVQTYDNGDVVRWNQLTVAGKAEPDHPAPHLALAASSDVAAPVADTAQVNPTAAGASDGTARWLGGVGIVIAAVAFGFGLGAFLRRRPA